MVRQADLKRLVNRELQRRAAGLKARSVSETDEVLWDSMSGLPEAVVTLNAPTDGDTVCMQYIISPCSASVLHERTTR